MKVIVAGDYCPQYRAAELIDKGDFIPVFGDIKETLKQADYSVVNLECPICKGGEKPIIKQGPNLCCTERGVDAIKWAGFDCVTLANNHFYDFGDVGVKKTLEKCNQAGIDTVGGGMNLKEASTTLYKKIGNTTLAIINCCEHEFSIATEHRGGSNPLSLVHQYYAISQARQNADYVIVIVHGGHEHFQYPSLRMVETYRFFIDVGADAVVNHHQHCPCGYENYNGKPIYYGLGNFCFDWEGKQESIWNIGYMVELVFDENRRINTEIITYKQCNEVPAVKLLAGQELESFKRMFEDLSSIIQDSDALVCKLNAFNQKNDHLYRKMLEPYSGRIASGMYRRGWLPSTIRKERVIALMDFLNCESHHERVSELLMRLYKHYFNEQN